MKHYAVHLLVFCFMALPACAENASPSPVDSIVSQAESAIAAAPSADRYAALALALARRARETEDPSYYPRAEAVIGKSLALAPDNREARRVRVLVKLGEHDFAAALAEARTLNQTGPDDLLVYAYLVDANVELGNYTEAEQAAQWLIDMRPGNLLGLTRAAKLREVFGDVDGALEFLSMALTRTPLAELEDQASILVQMAQLELMRGRAAPAETLVNEALSRAHASPGALHVLARIQSARGRHREAIGAFRRLVQAVPRAGNYFELAHALVQAGQGKQAAAAFAEFERRARAEMANLDNANRELSLYYADRAGQPAAALRVARVELARRQDVYTRDAYAWALQVNGRHREAWREISAVLSVGIRDAQILQHAGIIARSAGDYRSARRYFADAYTLAPWLKKPARG